MLRLNGIVIQGLGHFTHRMTNWSAVFQDATGQRLYPGTLNVDVKNDVPVKEHFRIRGSAINEPDQDLLFEVCRVNGIWGYRIRPYHLPTGLGGHGDHILEITCDQKIPNSGVGMAVDVEFFRNVP